MAVWGSGTLEDPWRVTDWDNFVDKCNAPVADAEERHYIEFPTHDQNGNLIPPEQRIIDMRHHDWYVDVNKSNLGQQGIIELTINGNEPYKTIEGNGWTILGLSLRNSILFYIGRTKYTGNVPKHRERADEVKNLNFQNIYLHGSCYLFCTYSSKTRISVSGCKFSGVVDNSINDPYSTIKTSGSAIFGIATSSGYTTATSCSFNFKFINLFKASLLYGTSGGVYNDGMEFNNCLFNIEGKIKPTTEYENGTNNHNKYYMFFAVFYFCKITGKFIVDKSSGSSTYAYLLSDVNGSLNVIDIYISSPNPGWSYPYYLLHYLKNASEVSIRYIEYDKAATKNNMSIQTFGNAGFKIPADRAQLTDKDWLENQGFVIGTPPTI